MHCIFQYCQLDHTNLLISTEQEHFTNFVNNMENIRRVNLDPSLTYWWECVDVTSMRE